MSRAVSTKDAPEAIGPYSQAVFSGDLLFVSGQLALDPETGRLVGSTCAEQATQALRNLEAVVKAAGLGLERVVKTTVFLADMADFPALNEVYASFFGKGVTFPARSTVEAAALPKGALVEIEAIASRKD